MNDMECRIYYTELVQLGNCRESNGRLLPLCVWYKAGVAAGLRTSAQRKDGCEVGEPMKINWNLYLFLTASNLSDAGGRRSR